MQQRTDLLLSETELESLDSHEVDIARHGLFPHALQLLQSVADFSADGLRIDSPEEAKLTCERLTRMRIELERQQRTAEALKRLYRTSRTASCAVIAH